MPQHVTVQPTRFNARGEAEAFDRDGRKVRVWGGIPGERARVKIVHQGQYSDGATWQQGRPDDGSRVTPRCDRYFLCGGCPLMHLNGAGQLTAKESLIRQALAKVELDDVEVAPVIRSPDGWDDFRHVVKLGVGFSDRGRIRVGAFGRRTKQIVPIPNCHVAAPILRDAMKAVAHHLIDMGIAPYDPHQDLGVMRSIVLRGSRSDNQVLITFVAGRRTRVLTELAERVAAQVGEVAGIALHLNSEPGNAIYHRDEEGEVRFLPLMGRMYLDETLDGVTYRIGPGDFFQTNPSVAELLYRQTLDGLDLSEGTPFLDLYCGVGGFALSAARTTGWALGVEGLKGAVQSAREAARRQRIPAEFRAGRLEEVVDELGDRVKGTRPVVTVNPARRGLEDGVADGILELRPRRMAYISCNPKAMARDLARFVEAGMELQRIQPYDMFPNTAHVESVAFLRSTDDARPSRRAPRRKVVARSTDRSS